MYYAEISEHFWSKTVGGTVMITKEGNGTKLNVNKVEKLQKFENFYSFIKTTAKKKKKKKLNSISMIEIAKLKSFKSAILQTVQFIIISFFFLPNIFCSNKQN